MPLRPRLPVGGIQLAAHSAISKELQDTTCGDKTCCKEEKKQKDLPPPTVPSSSCHDHGHHHEHHHDNPQQSMLTPLPVTADNPMSSLSQLDLFRFEDIPDDMLMIQSTEPMVFDDSIMTLVTEESDPNNAPVQNVMAPPPPLHRLKQPEQILSDNTNIQQPQQPQQQQQQQVDAHVLHRTVLLFPNDVSLVQTALIGGPPQAVLTPSPSAHHGYSYPLHMALCQGASLPVLQLLVQAGPQVLLQKDGPEALTPLMLALIHWPNRTDVHQLLRKTWPQASSIACGAQQDLPLHVACRNGLPLELVQALLQDHPSAVLQANSRGLTPLHIVVSLGQSQSSSLLYQSLQRVAQSLLPPPQQKLSGMPQLQQTC